MKQLSLFLLLLTVCFAAQVAMAQGYTLFPQEKYTDLVVTSTDPSAPSFIVKSNQGAQMQGHIGDYLGIEEAEVVAITDQDVTLETVQLIEDKEGNQREQRSRLQLPLSFSVYGMGKGTRNGQ